MLHRLRRTQTKVRVGRAKITVSVAPECVSYDRGRSVCLLFASILCRIGRLSRIGGCDLSRSKRSILQGGQVGIILIVGCTKLQQTTMKRSSA